MNPVRPLRKDDLQQVAALYETRLSGGRQARPGMVEQFCHQFLEAPTADPEIPSLVATDAVGKVVGFLGANVTPMTLDGRPVRAVATGPMFTDPDARVASVLLLRSLLTGPQAFTFSDKHNLEAHRLLARLGARRPPPLRVAGGRAASSRALGVDDDVASKEVVDAVAPSCSTAHRWRVERTAPQGSRWNDPGRRPLDTRARDGGSPGTHGPGAPAPDVR